MFLALGYLVLESAVDPDAVPASDYLHLRIGTKGGVSKQG